MSLWYLNEIVFHVLDYAFVTAAVTACTVRTTLRSPQDDLMLFAEFANKLFLVLFGPGYVSPPPSSHAQLDSVRLFDEIKILLSELSRKLSVTVL